jgi:hypothetical protein
MNGSAMIPGVFSKLKLVAKKLGFGALGALQGMPTDAASHLDTLSQHTDAILGKSKQHLHEIYSPDLHIDVMHYAPSGDRNFHYLITSGMSDRPMTDAGDAIEEPFMELAIALPEDWDVSAKGFEDPATFEPIKLLKLLARYPNANGTYLAKYHDRDLRSCASLDLLGLFHPQSNQWRTRDSRRKRHSGLICWHSEVRGRGPSGS